jgi:hypothetical protein
MLRHSIISTTYLICKIGSQYEILNKEVSYEIQQIVLKKVTNHKNTAFETFGKVDCGNIINV